MRRSLAGDMAALNRVLLLVKAAIEDHPILLPALHEARDAGFLTRGDGGPTGKGGHSDLSDRLRYTPEVRQADGTVVGGDLLLWQDPAERDLADLGRGLQLLMEGTAIIRLVATTNLEHPASSNYCRGGQCPDGKMAERGKQGRCSACSAHWYAVSNPAARRERDYVGQPRPSRDGCHSEGIDRMSRVAC